MKFKNKIIVVCLCVSVFAGGCGQGGQNTTKSKNSEGTASSKESTERTSQDNEASKDIFAMDTYMTVTAYGEKAQDAVDAAEAEIERLDTLLSTGNADSEIVKLNEQKSATLSEDGGYLVKRALELNKETDGAFDIAIYPVMEAWGFPIQNFRVPSADELTGLLKHVDAAKISYDKDTREISFEDDQMKIDLGGIAKGYTSSRIMDIFKESGITSGLVNLGGNYVHSMEYASKPGLLLIKMNDSFLETILGKDRSMTDEVQIGILDKKGNLCADWCPKGTKISDAVKQEVYKISAQETSGILAKSRRVSGGVCSIYKESSSEMTVFTVVPSSVMTQGTMRVLMVLIGIYLFVAVVAVVLSIYFSKRFTSPIREISEEMTQFDGNDFSRLIELNTNTELDQIGHSYNKMLKNIENLLAEIKEQEGVLRRTELNMLLAQINPHFLYNTLDTIYMLARINGEETTMKMIQALSRYLRLSLSKGSDIVTVEDELENVKSYMEIQQIRNANLFRYEIECKVEEKSTWMLKLILQPLVENAIKHGFCEIYENGLIRIEIAREDSQLKIVVFNNGKPIDREMMEKINALNGHPILEAKKCFQDKEHGYGVVNVLTRLRLKYGEDVLFYYEAEENGTRCTIQIPDDGKEKRDL